MCDQEDAIAAWRQKLNDNTELKLQKHRLSDHECAHLGMALLEDVAVQSLKLRSDGMGVIGITSLAEGLCGNSSLTEFGLNGNNGVGDEGSEIIAEALKENGRLSSLQLYGFGIGREGAVGLSGALRFNQSLMILDLEKNNIRADGVFAFSEILKVNSTLVELNIINNTIGDLGAEYMADCLRLNKGLKILYLQQNQIGDEGAGHIAEALKVNTTLTTLGLGSNHGISADGNHIIAQGLQNNDTLAWLSGVELSAYSQDIFALSKKQLDKIDMDGGDMNNVKLLQEAKVTRELTRIRYANFTAKYRKDSRDKAMKKCRSNQPNNNRVIATKTSNRGSSGGGDNAAASSSSSKRLLSSTMKMGFEESSMKSRMRK